MSCLDAYNSIRRFYCTHGNQFNLSLTINQPVVCSESVVSEGLFMKSVHVINNMFIVRLLDVFKAHSLFLLVGPPEHNITHRRRIFGVGIAIVTRKG